MSQPRLLPVLLQVALRVVKHRVVLLVRWLVPWRLGRVKFRILVSCIDLVYSVVLGRARANYSFLLDDEKDDDDW